MNSTAKDQNCELIVTNGHSFTILLRIRSVPCWDDISITSNGSNNKLIWFHMQSYHIRLIFDHVVIFDLKVRRTLFENTYRCFVLRMNIKEYWKINIRVALPSALLICTTETFGKSCDEILLIVLLAASSKICAQNEEAMIGWLLFCTYGIEGQLVSMKKRPKMVCYPELSKFLNISFLWFSTDWLQRELWCFDLIILNLVSNLPKHLFLCLENPLLRCWRHGLILDSCAVTFSVPSYKLGEITLIK